MNCNILILDNTTSLTSPWKKVITENFDTTEAVGGFEAVIKLRSEDFDMVIVNISLKQLNGTDAIRKIREKYPQIPILVLYAEADHLNLKQVKTYGIQGALLTPVNLKMLLLSISKLLPARKRQAPPNTAVNTAPAPVKEKEKEFNIEERFYEGLSLIAAKKYRDAVEVYKSITKVTNIKVPSWLRYINESFFQLGQCYAQLEEYDASNNNFVNFVNKAPHHNCVKEAILFLGKNYESLGNFNKARLYYQKVFNMRPMDTFTTEARKNLKRLEQYFTGKRA